MRTLSVLFVEFSIVSARLNYGIASLSAIAKERGHSVALAEILSETEEGISQALEKRRNFSPDLVAISVNNVFSDLVSPTALLAKKIFPGVLVALGGSYPTLSTNEATALAGVDICFVGESECAFGRILDKLAKTKPRKVAPRRLARGLLGVSVKDSRGTPTFPGFSPLPELSKLPLPDLSIFRESAIRVKDSSGRVHFTALVSRGCLFSCSYCYGSRACNPLGRKKNYYRRLSNEKAIEFLSQAKEKYRPEIIDFLDNIIFPPGKNAEEFASKYAREIGIASAGMMRPEFCSKSFAKVLSKCLVEETCIGVEAGTNSIRKKFLSRSYTDKALEKSFNNIMSKGISAKASSMIGFPYQTREDIFSLFRLIARLTPSYIYQVFFPTKGTILGELCHSKGWVSREKKPIRSFLVSRTTLETNGVLRAHEIDFLFRIARTATEYYRGNFGGAFVNAGKATFRAGAEAALGEIGFLHRFATQRNQ